MLKITACQKTLMHTAFSFMAAFRNTCFFFFMIKLITDHTFYGNNLRFFVACCKFGLLILLAPFFELFSFSCYAIFVTGGYLFCFKRVADPEGLGGVLSNTLPATCF